MTTLHIFILIYAAVGVGMALGAILTEKVYMSPGLVLTVILIVYIIFATAMVWPLVALNYVVTNAYEMKLKGAQR